MMIVRNSKNGAVELEWNYFNGINLIAKTFKTTIQFGKYHTEFTLVIFDHKLEKLHSNLLFMTLMFFSLYAI